MFSNPTSPKNASLGSLYCIQAHFLIPLRRLFGFQAHYRSKELARYIGLIWHVSRFLNFVLSYVRKTPIQIILHRIPPAFHVIMLQLIAYIAPRLHSYVQNA
jgi:hypothetical protein